LLLLFSPSLGLCLSSAFRLPLFFFFCFFFFFRFLFD